MLQQRQLPSVVDVEPFFNTGTERTKEDITAFRKYLLPQATVLSGTVREIKSLLDDAGIPTGYPRGIPDIKLMGEALGKFLGPKYVIVKREILDAEEHATTLHCVLSGPTTSSLESYRCHNPTALFGVSYSIPGTSRMGTVFAEHHGLTQLQRRLRRIWPEDAASLMQSRPGTSLWRKCSREANTLYRPRYFSSLKTDTKVYLPRCRPS